MQIEQIDLADAATVRACYEVYVAALQADKAVGPWLSPGRFGGWFAVGWVGDPREAWLVRAADETDDDEADRMSRGAVAEMSRGAVAGWYRGAVAGISRGAVAGMSEGAVAGWYRLELPDRENLDRARLELFVRPDRRRRGLGRGLLRHAAARAAAQGRRVLDSAAQNGSAGEGFAQAMGARAGLVDVQRMLELAELGADRLAELRGQAEQATAGYSLVSWTGPVPDEFLEQAGALFTALGDAPHDPGAVPVIWDAQQVRERVNDLLPRFGMRLFSLAARHDPSGEMAALTQMAVDPTDPGWGHQLITAVISKHRGHRLGLLVKTAMLELLASSEPQLERISTWNAEANQHMIAVNQVIGYTVLGPPNTEWRLDVPALLG
jgi:GNAT superfamily N-acetyltransferase/RimJ/RimL family protein N-acetyltransferase